MTSPSHSVPDDEFTECPCGYEKAIMKTTFYTTFLGCPKCGKTYINNGWDWSEMPTLEEMEELLRSNKQIKEDKSK